MLLSTMRGIPPLSCLYIHHLSFCTIIYTFAFKGSHTFSTEMGSFQLANGPSPLSLSSSFILPENKRPYLSQVSTVASIPVIDLNQELSQLIQQVSRACEEYGFFQIINHGVSQELCERMLKTISEFFELPPQERAKFFTTDHTKQIKLFNYNLKVDGQEDKVSMWSETFSHPLHPLDDVAHLLPENPPQYRYFFFFLSFSVSAISKVA